MYILRCADGTLYTGITNDLAARIAMHESGAGAKYTRGRGPFVLVHHENHPNRGAATRREMEIKAMDRAMKLSLSGFHKK